MYVIISILLPLLAMKAGRPVGMRYRTRLGEMKSLVLESVYGIKDIQIFGFGNRQLERVLEQNRKVNQAAHGLTMHKPVSYTHLGIKRSSLALNLIKICCPYTEAYRSLPP